MAGPVSLSDIIEALELKDDEFLSFLNTKTGVVETVSREEMSATEEDEPPERFPDWQRENIKVAVKILESDEYIALPTNYDIDEYNIMEEFCRSLDDQLRDAMCNSIRGSGAFSRFKDNIRRFNLEEAWYRYLTRASGRLPSSGARRTRSALRRINSFLMRFSGPQSEAVGS